ncbi:hypothetical protein [[Eubacterium] cellulosolvens]
MAEPAITISILMLPYIKYLLETLKNIRLQLLIGVLCFFFIAVFLTTLPGDIYIYLWLLLGAFTLYFIRLTFPDVWNYTFWLMGIFFLNFLAMICFLDTKFTSHFLFSFIGFFLELATLGIDILLILHIKAIRDDISGVTERPTGMELEHEAKYIPLGLWSLMVFLFWFVSNLSIFYWFQWSVAKSGMEGYIISEIVLMFIVVYILWHPQVKFDWGVEALLLPDKKLISKDKALIKYSKLLPKLRKTVRAKPGLPKKCPICGAKIVVEKRRCSNCGENRIFTWCKIQEGYIVTCPHCKALTSYGKERCIRCGRLINRNIRCTCGVEKEIRDWNFLQITSAK